MLRLLIHDNISVGRPWALLPVAFLLLLLGCAPSRTVSIPREYQSPAPPVSPHATPQATQLGSQQPTSTQEAILKPPPTIKEKDLSAGAEPVAPPPPPSEKKVQSQPQHMASMHLVDQAKASLSQGKADHAISLLEQAIQVDVYNGEAFLSLARAWKMKKSRDKALEFSRKAEILFQDRPPKLKEVYLLEAEIYKEKGEAGKAESFRQKASKLK